MKNVQIRNVSNGFVVIMPPQPGASPTAPVELVFNTWEQVTSYLTEQGFIK